MVIPDMMRAARYANDPGYFEANRLYEVAVLELDNLNMLAEASELRLNAAYSRVEGAARSYSQKLEDEISVAPAQQCDCQKDADA
jgi:hypothetical protein